MTELLTISDIGRGETRMAVGVMRPAEPRIRGLALALHGRNGAPEAPHMLAISRALIAHGYAVIVPALRNSAPNSEAGTAGGHPSRFTMTAQVEDAGRVVDWVLKGGAGGAGVPAGPMLIAGHSMGAYAALRLAGERGPKAVTHVLGVAAVVSGRAILEARAAMGQPALDALEAEVPGAAFEYATHDLAHLTPNLDLPIAFVSGERDGLALPSDVSAFAATLPTPPHHEIVAGADHCPTGPLVDAALDRAVAALVEAGA
ncbi:MAG: hypothetical protein AAGG47_06740 [Pseudomonadota bacterium]